MVKDQLQDKIKEALKSGDSLKVSTYRMLLAALNNEQIAKQHDLSEDEELAVIKRQLKQREEAAEALRQAQGKPGILNATNFEERIAQETKEAELLKEFLPEQMSEEQVSQIVDQVISEIGDTKDFGKVMGQVMAKIQGKADGKVVSELVRQKLSK